VVAIDAFFPVVPGDAATITAAIVAAEADLSIVLVVAAGFLGATRATTSPTSWDTTSGVGPRAGCFAAISREHASSGRATS
jgi:hypothetical protein